MRQIKNLRAVSDDEELLHLFSFRPIAIGTIEEIDGKKYRVIDNSVTTIVSYEPIEDGEEEL